MSQSTDRRLVLHLRDWLGRWPSATTLDVVGSVRRVRPGWDGRLFPVIGVRGPRTGVLSVPPARSSVVRSRVTQLAANGAAWEELLPNLAHLLGRGDQYVYSGVFRWCDHPADLPEAGVWVDAGDQVVPDWLRPFGHEVLIAWDAETGNYLAGVGLKHHDEYCRELAVGTHASARGRGLARRLVAQAARRVLDEGRIPTYQHDAANVASARVADAAGFPDRGWRSVGMA